MIRTQAAFRLSGLAVLALLLPACGAGDTGPQGPAGPPASIAAGAGIVATPDPIVDTGTIAVDFAGSGAATTVSRSDHDHDADYLALSGGTLTGGLTVGGVLSGDGSGLTALDAGNLTAGTLPGGRLGGTYAGSVTMSNTGNAFTGSFTLGAPATRYLSVPSSAFRAEDTVFQHAGFPAIYSWGNSVLYVAPLQLPHGAQITEVRAVFLDNSDLVQVTVLLTRSPDDGSYANLASLSSGNAAASAAIQSVALAAAGPEPFPLAVNNELYAYHLLFHHGGHQDRLKLYRVRVTYTVTSPLP